MEIEIEEISNVVMTAGTECWEVGVRKLTSVDKGGTSEIWAGMCWRNNSLITTWSGNSEVVRNNAEDIVDLLGPILTHGYTPGDHIVEMIRIWTTK